MAKTEYYNLIKTVLHIIIMPREGVAGSDKKY